MCECYLWSPCYSCYWIGEYQLCRSFQSWNTVAWNCDIGWFVHRGVGKRGQYLKMLKDARVSSGIFWKGMPYSLIINHKKTIPNKSRFTPKTGFGCRTKGDVFLWFNPGCTHGLTGMNKSVLIEIQKVFEEGLLSPTWSTTFSQIFLRISNCDQANSKCVRPCASSRCEWEEGSQASTLTQNDTGPVGPLTPSIYWSCKMFTGPTFFL